MTCLLLLLLLATGTPSAGTPSAGAPSAGDAPVAPVAAALADADADGLPDRAGRRVRVAGRATTSAGRLGDPEADFVLQDASGGVRVQARDRAAVRAVARGDSVVVEGRVESSNGMARLADAVVRRVGTPPRFVRPRPYPHTARESAEGQLVTVEGLVIGVSHVPAGTALMLSDEARLPLTVFLFTGRRGAFPLDDYQPGDAVRVTGIAGQFDRTAPHAEGYQVWPRRAEDIERVGLAARTVRRAAFGALALLALALAWAALLRREVGRRLAEARRADDRYRTLFDAASDAVVVHGFRPEAPMEFNPAARRALGLPDDAPPPASFAPVHPADAGRATAHLRQVAETGHARTDLRVVRADGTAATFEFDSQALVLDGHRRVLSLARDVSATRAREQALDDARRLAEETARAKSAFLAAMSHEIRTPLTAILGFAEILREEVGPEQTDLVEAIEAGGARLLATLNSVLDLARLDASRGALRAAPTCLADHTRQSLRLLGSLAARKGLALTLDAPDALAAHVDAGAFERVLVNLVGNAVKFTDVGGVAVSLHAEAGPGGPGVVLRVADTGIGMDAAFLPHVFDEFRQASEGEARSHEGSGLGMALTKRLVERMGGEIAVESAPGAGTTFTVTLPREPLEAQPGRLALQEAD